MSGVPLTRLTFLARSPGNFRSGTLELFHFLHVTVVSFVRSSFQVIEVRIMTVITAKFAFRAFSIIKPFALRTECKVFYIPAF